MQPTALIRGAAAIVALAAALCSAEAPPLAAAAASPVAAASSSLPRRAVDDGEAAEVAAAGAEDDLSLLQQPFLAPRDKATAAEGESEPSALEPYLIGLRRESVPVYRRGKVASYKTSYSGVIHVGSPAQEFRVVFDTGSGHIVLPAAECQSEACLVPGRRKFDMHASATAVPINENGAVVPTGEACDQVTIGFGTGEITGEFTRDRVCFGGPGHAGALAPEVGEVEVEEPTDSSALATNATQGVEVEEELCVEMSVILAVEMSSQPFKTFNFDGILGLGLDALALNSNFSAFAMLLGRGLPTGHFGVFLTEGEEGEESEIAIGAADSRRMLEPLHWAPVMLPEHGHWQVQILSIRIGGQTLDICRDGTCRGVVDTGTSHLGVPAPADAEVAGLLTTEAGDILDCRVVEAPEVEIELPGYSLTLRPHNYMRRLPLRDGVSVSSAHGVQAKAPATEAAASAPTAVAGAAGASASGAGEAPANGAAVETAEQEEAVRRFCRPRLMPVRLPAPLGPKLFILGEPVLHRYYTVYDWENQRVGFSLANSRRNTMSVAELVGDGRGALPKEVDVLLMQQRVTVARSTGGGGGAGVAGGSDQLDAVAARAMEEALPEATILMQVELKISVRRRVL